MSLVSNLVAAPAQEHPEPPRRLGVPWLTVVALAAVLAYADGFWMTSLRGAVGAIERTQETVHRWWRESTLRCRCSCSPCSGH